MDKLKLAALCSLTVSGLAGGAAIISFMGITYYQIWNPLTTCAFGTGSMYCDHSGGKIFYQALPVSLTIAVLGGIAGLRYLVLWRQARRMEPVMPSQQGAAPDSDESLDVLGELHRIRAQGLSGREQERQVEALRERLRRESGSG